MAGSWSMNIIVVPVIIALCCSSSVVARAIASIALGIITGVCLPLLGRATFTSYTSYRLDRNTIFVIRAFVVGLVLATALLQLLLPYAFKSPPSGISSWQNFPFPGLVATFTALCVLVVEALATGYSHLKNQNKPSDKGKGLAANGKDSQGPAYVSNIIDEDSRIGHGVISQVLELAIISQLTLVVIPLIGSQSPWMAIRTLVAAFTTQQFLEGMSRCKVQERFNCKFRAIPRISALFAGVATGIGVLY